VAEENAAGDASRRMESSNGVFRNCEPTINSTRSVQFSFPVDAEDGGGAVIAEHKSPSQRSAERLKDTCVSCPVATDTLDQQH
jgi:hypothetical protein